jgi:AcrR family transcriptional regulator
LVTDCPVRKRRKHARPAEIVEAARICFINDGFGATRIEDVARRAGVSKGTVYLYFESKEALFEAVIRANVAPVIGSVTAALEVDPTTPAAEQLEFCARTIYREMVGTERRKLLQLVIAEGTRFPWVAEFYYREVVSKGQALIRAIIRRGEQRGELTANGLDRYPEILMGPTIVAAIFSLIFSAHAPSDLEDYIDAHLKAGLKALEVRPR